MGVQVSGVLVAGVLALAVSGRASAQKPADREAPKGKPCDMVEMTIRLRLSHPLGATRSEERQCPAHAGNWVRTFRIGDREALAWRRALAGLRGSADARCRLAARTLVWLERTGLVSVAREVAHRGSLPQPDVLVIPTVSDIARGRDAELDAVRTHVLRQAPKTPGE